MKTTNANQNFHSNTDSTISTKKVSSQIQIDTNSTVSGSLLVGGATLDAVRENHVTTFSTKKSEKYFNTKRR